MADWQGFWSYVHADDDAENGRISALARDLVAQFQMSSGESISLFLDKDAIEWGDNWRDSIDTSLESVAFFVPVLTPRYFMSAECRRELQFFARKAKALGMKELVLPLLYADVRQFQEDTGTDDLITLVRSFQWEDWRDLRFFDRSSEHYRRGVARLTERLIEASRRTPTIGVSEMKISEPGVVDGVADDSPGFIDLAATSEEALPKLTSSLEFLRDDIERIGEIMSAGAKEMTAADSHGNGYAVRLFVARKIANGLKGPIERLEANANEYLSRLHDVDQGFRVIIGESASIVVQDESSKEAVCSFFKVVRSVGDSAHESFNSIQGMIDSVSFVEKLSRDLRPILRRLRKALTAMVEGRGVIDEWVRMIEKSPIECVEEKS